MVHIFRAYTFSYSLSRPYPYKWFPWVTCVGAVLLAVLFSAINVAAVGYEIELQITTTPNETLGHKSWTDRAPFSWFDKTRASCQPQNIPVQSQFFTNNSGLTYSLERVYQMRSDDSQIVLPSVSYMNNVIQSCNVTSINFDISTTGRTAEQTQDFSWGIDALAYVTCSLDTTDPPTYLDLHARYDYFPALIERQTLLELNATSRASLWWGQSLLSWQYLNLASFVASHAANPLADSGTVTQKFFARASYYLEPSFDITPNSSNLTSIRHSKFENWRILCYETVNGVLSADYTYPPEFCQGADTNWNDLDIANFANGIWQPAHDYAMAMASTILVDVGNNSPDNMLISPAYLQYYSANFTSIQSAVESILFNDGRYLPKYLPSNSTYEELKDTTGPLGITPSVIYTQYTCQVPRQKSPGSMIISVFVADLVFLQATWTVFTFLTTSWLHRRDPDAANCLGCLELKRQLDQEGMLLQSRNTPSKVDNTSKLPLLQQSEESETVAP